MPRLGSDEDVADHVTEDIRQPEVSAGVTGREAFVVEPEAPGTEGNNAGNTHWRPEAFLNEKAAGSLR